MALYGTVETQLSLTSLWCSTSNESLVRALNRFGLPATFIRYVMAANTDCTTKAFMDRQYSAPINVRRGVKQGDPLSYLLFIMVIDELLLELDKSFAVRQQLDQKYRSVRTI